MSYPFTIELKLPPCCENCGTDKNTAWAFYQREIDGNTRLEVPLCGFCFTRMEMSSDE